MACIYKDTGCKVISQKAGNFLKNKKINFFGFSPERSPQLNQKRAKTNASRVLRRGMPTPRH
jgi:hypothetical protein